MQLLPHEIRGSRHALNQSNCIVIDPGYLKSMKNKLVMNKSVSWMDAAKCGIEIYRKQSLGDYRFEDDMP